MVGNEGAIVQWIILVVFGVDDECLHCGGQRSGHFLWMLLLLMLLLRKYFSREGGNYCNLVVASPHASSIQSPHDSSRSASRMSWEYFASHVKRTESPLLSISIMCSSGMLAARWWTRNL